jgi:hypothetical protein
VAASLHAARTSLLQVTPELCVDYLDAWRHDRRRWRRFIERLPEETSPERAVKALDLVP